MIAPDDIRAAKRLLADHRKERRRQQPKPAKREARVQHGKVREGDRGRIRDPGFLAFCRRQPCAVGPIGCNGPIQACHIRYGRPGEPPTGLQRKPSDRRAVGMCRGHHLDNPDAQHKSGERQWWSARGIDPHALADALFAAYQTEGHRG